MRYRVRGRLRVEVAGDGPDVGAAFAAVAQALVQRDHGGLSS